MKREGYGTMVSAAEIVALQDRLTWEWHATDGSVAGGIEAGGDWLSLLSRQHKANFDLWHIEDEARTPGASDAEIADVKRRIDRTNQTRNDLVEELDRAIQKWLEERGLSESRCAVEFRVAGIDDRQALDSDAEDLSHARRIGTAGCARWTCGTKSRAAGDS